MPEDEAIRNAMYVTGDKAQKTRKAPGEEEWQFGVP